MSILKRRVATFLAALLVAGIGVFAIQSPASAGIPVYGGPIFGPYSIQRADPNNGSPKCLDVSGNSYANGAAMQMWDCLGTGQYNQQFYFWAVGDGWPYYYITPSSTWKCLDVRGVSGANYAVIQQYDCLGNHQYNQMWDVWFDDRPGYSRWHIFSINSWKSLAHAWPPNNGAAVYQLDEQYIWTFCSGNGSCV